MLSDPLARFERWLAFAAHMINLIVFFCFYRFFRLFLFRIAHEAKNFDAVTDESIRGRSQHRSAYALEHFVFFFFLSICGACKGDGVQPWRDTQMAEAKESRRVLHVFRRSRIYWHRRLPFDTDVRLLTMFWCCVASSWEYPPILFEKKTDIMFVRFDTDANFDDVRIDKNTTRVNVAGASWMQMRRNVFRNGNSPANSNLSFVCLFE